MATMLDKTNATTFFTPPADSPYPAILETTWASIIARYPAQHIDFAISLFNPLLTFWIPGLILTYFLPSPPFTKFQPASRQPSNPKILRGALYSFRNQLVIHGVHAIALLFPATQRENKVLKFRVETPLPRPWELLWQFAVALVIREVMFYYSHRVFHWRGVYQWVHKMHHEFVTPTAWSAQYCTLFEHVLANVLPILVPGLLLRMHIVTFALWSGSQSLQATIDHAGWNTWLWWQAQSHDRHHELFKVNFGTNGLLDWIHGTQDKYPKGAKIEPVEPEKMHYD